MKKEEEKKKELEIERIKMVNAKQYYERGLLIKFGISRLLKNVELQKQKYKTAEDQNKKWIKINGWAIFKDGMS